MIVKVLGFPESVLDAMRNIRSASFTGEAPTLIRCSGKTMNAILGTDRLIDDNIYQAQIDAETKTAKVRCLG